MYGLVCLIFFSLATATVSGDTCDELLQKSDECYKRIVYVGNKEAKIPQNLEQDMVKHCNSMKQDVQCYRSYGKCMKLFGKQVFNIMLTGARKEYKFRCGSNEGRKAFLSSTFRSEDKANYDALADQLVSFYDFAAENVTEEEMLPNMCCGYFYLNEELYSRVAKSYGKFHATYTKTGMKNLFSEVIDLSCGKYSSQQQCKSLLPGSSARFHGKPPTRASDHFIWEPLVKIIFKLGQ